MKNATTVILEAGDKRLSLQRHEFNHAMNCLGERVSAFGKVNCKVMKTRINMAFRNIALHPKEFTADEIEAKIKGEVVILAPMTEERTKAVLTKVQQFVNTVGDNNDIHY